MLRDPKEVAAEARAAMSVLFDRKYGGQDINHAVDTGAAIEAAIRARDREVIAEAKRVLIDECGGHGETAPTCCDNCYVKWSMVRECVAALDAILKEKE